MPLPYHEGALGGLKYSWSVGRELTLAAVGGTKYTGLETEGLEELNATACTGRNLQHAQRTHRSTG